MAIFLGAGVLHNNIMLKAEIKEKKVGSSYLRCLESKWKAIDGKVIDANPSLTSCYLKKKTFCRCI